jgi:hypothetical protein
MNLYASTMKGIRAAKESYHRRILQEMAAAAIRKSEGLGFDLSKQSTRNPVTLSLRRKSTTVPDPAPRSHPHKDAERN